MNIKKVLLLALIAVIIGSASTYFILNTDWTNKRTEVWTGTTTVNSIKEVFKLVTSEVTVEKIHTYKDIDGYQYLPDEFFSKEMIVIVTATASLGYNIDSVQIKAVDSTLTIELTLPPLEILSLDTDYRVQHLSQSAGNKLKAADLNIVYAEAKAKAEQGVYESEAYLRASQSSDAKIEQLRVFTAKYGWDLKVRKDTMLH